MRFSASPLTANEWVTALFRSRAAASGGVIRRKAKDVERYVGRIEFEQELKRRGFHAVENAGQIVIFCNQEPIRIVL